MRACLLILSALVLFHAKAQVLLSNQNSYSLKNHIFLLKETRPLSITGVVTFYQQKKFSPVATENNSIEWGFIKNIYWVAIPVRNMLASEQNLLTGIDNGGIFSVEYFLCDSSGKVMAHYLTGNRFDFSTRPIADRHFFFPLTVAAQQPAIIFFRVDMRGNALHLPLKIISPQQLQIFNSKLSLFYALYSAGLLFICFLGMLSFLWIKNTVYLFYAAYVFSYFLCFLGDGNYDVLWLYPHLPFLSSLSPAMYGFALCFFMLLFMSRFLKLPSTHPKFYRLLKIWFVFLLSNLLLLPVAYLTFTNIFLRGFAFYFTFISFMGSIILQVVGILLRMKDRYQPAYLYGSALVFVFLSFVFYVLRITNVIPDLIPSFIYVPLGFGLEILILSFALIYSYNYYKTKHDQLSVSLAEQQLNFSEQLLQVQQTEQKRIAQDLHDELGGNLAALKMNLQSLNLPDETAAKNIIDLIDAASDNARNIAHNLMPPHFENTSLAGLLPAFFNRLNGENKIQFHFFTSGDNHHFSKQAELVIYRIIMELTNNIIKHSDASEATIQLIYYNDHLGIITEDNGKGFDAASSAGMGMQNIQSRIQYLQGEMNIDSGEKGTTIIIKIPYKKS